jgi:16S rRNA (guanine1207-N2)-methyltransferase
VSNPADEEHYFTADPSVPFTRKPVRTQVWGHDLDLESGSGVFAQGRVDLGTSVLFREAEPQAQDGPFLDLGCGYGVVAVALAVVRPQAEVWAVDVNERALLLTRENAAAAGARVHAVRPEEVPQDLRFTEIWSNPPIRIGKQALHDLLLTWLPRLAPGGRAVLVVGRNLGADSLQRWLGEQGFPATRIASAKGFRVLEVRSEGRMTT